jgi:hypothetical protein
LLDDGAHHNWIGGSGPGTGNVISLGNGFVAGILVFNGSGANVIEGNKLGTNAAGDAALGNLYGLQVVDSPDTRIVGNLASGNLVDGIAVWGSASTGTVIQGNLIGTDVTGTQPIPNGFNGLRLIDISGALIGGVGAAERNVSSGNGDSGIVITRGGHNRVVGNYVGTDITGTQPLGNRVDGIYLPDSSGNEIGASELGAGNVIAANGAGGIDLVGTSNGNTITGNRIGMDVTGTIAIPNFLGIRIAGGSDNRIGTNAAAGNVIAGNATHGIVVSDPSAIRNRMQGNSIYANGALGIDLGSDGVTANDVGDGDSGANGLQNFPVLTGVQAGVNTNVTGTLSSAANATFTIDFYASAAGDASGFGEGQRWIGSIAVSTDGAGHAAFSGSLFASTVTGEFVTATATDLAGNTSEFSNGLEIQTLSVLIDVKPASSTNPLNLQENGVIPVAILTTLSFDASRVDASTVVFAGAMAVHSALEDVDHDGDLDMILHFRVQDTNLSALYAQLLLADLEDDVLDNNQQEASIELSGKTVDDVFFADSDAIDLFLAGRQLRDLLDDLLA